MEYTLVINPGSSSKKYALYNGGERVLSAIFERTGAGYEQCFEINGVRKQGEQSNENTFAHPLDTVLQLALERGIVGSKEDIARVGVRVVAPGTFFQTHKRIDERYKTELASKESAAPLHVPGTLDALERTVSVLPHATVIGASDSAFHNTIPAHARNYSISSEEATTHDIYRFGYHGLSIESAAKHAGQLLGGLPKKMVICHIGSGVSVAALKGGVSIDTSMGFTPGSGLMMSTRCGDIDPGALIYLLENKTLHGADAQRYIQTEGGFKGLLGTSDLRVALDRASKRDPKAVDAIDMFFYGIKKQIGACVAALGGIDALIFTAAAPERNPLVRKLVCDGLDTFGIALDHEKNNATVGVDGVISAEGSTVTAAVVRTREMDEIAFAVQSVT